MEVLGSVASVIAVVTLALQSTKVIYEVASSISHGSDDIDRLARATSNLEKLLEIIKRLAEHAEGTNSVAEGKLLEELTPLVDQCANALHEIAPKLVQLQKDSKDRRWKKAKKYARVYLDTKGVTEMWNTVNHHVELLGTCLGNASVDVGLYNAQKLHILHDELSAASRDNRSQFSHVENVLQDQRALAQAGLVAFQAEFHQGSLDARAAATTQIQGIAEIKTGQQQFEDAAAIGYERIANLQADVQDVRAIINDESHQATTRSEALMREVRGSISEATTSASMQIEEVGRMKAEVMQKLHSISDRLEAVPSMASEQLSTLQSLVEMMRGIQLGVRTGRQDPVNNTTSEAYLTENDRSDDSEMTYNPEIEGVIARICHLAGMVTTYRYSKEAQSLIEDIGRLLGLVMQQLSATGPSRDELPRKRKILCDHHYSELETAVQSMEDLAKAKRVLNASQRIRISNQDSRRIDENDNSAILFIDHPQNSLPENYRLRKALNANLQSIVRSWTLHHGRLDAIFRTTLLPDAEDQETESTDESFAAKVFVTPISAPPSNFQIIIDIASRTYQDRTIYFTPTITFRAMVPDGSEVFRVVEGGSVKKLKKLLSSGAASLGDCDSMGRSLLNFALYKCRRKMTKFLIQSGADVDTLEPRNAEDFSFHGDPNPVKPLYMIRSMNDVESADESRERVEGCYKLLLDAGSDFSSVNITEYNTKTFTGFCWASAFSNELHKGTLVKVKALLDLGEPFISPESTGDNNPRETIPLLLLADSHSQYWATNLQTSDKIALLLNRGANAKARNSRGETCLHLVFSKHHHEGKCWCDFEIVVWQHLSETKDIVVLMISAGADVCAVDEQGKSVSDAAIHSGQQRVWTEALKYCGIDIRDVLARPNVYPAHSTALSSRYSKPPRSVTSKISLTEYLERRKAFEEDPGDKYERNMRVVISSSEDDESEDEDLTEEASKTTEAEREASIEEDEEIHVIYEDGVARRKAKLE